MTTTRFVVELPQHNSDRDGTLVDIREALSRLIHISSSVFDHIEAKVSEENSRLGLLEERIRKAKSKIQQVAAQPSKACTLLCVSKLPNIIDGTGLQSLYKDVPLQRLGEGESDEARLKNRKNADEDDDPMVPQEALLDLDRRMALNVATRVRDNLEHIRQLEDKANVYPWSVSIRGATNGSEDDDEMGPPPQSLTNQKTFREEEPTIAAFEAKDVGYKPRSREAHNLGLPTTLGGILPDIAYHTKLFRSSGPVVDKPSNGRSNSPLAPPVAAPSLALSTGMMESETFAPAPTGADIVNKSQDRKDPVGRTSATEITVSKDNSEGISSESINVVDQVNKSTSGARQSTATATDSTRVNLLEEIRKGRALASAKADAQRNSAAGGSGQKLSLAGATSPTQAKRPTSLADEMREKLARRQKALSGERDEEEQQAERRRKGRDETWEDEKSSDSGSSLPSARSLAMPSRTLNVSSKRPREPVQSSKSSAPFAGLDALLNRELATKSLVVPRPPPKPASSIGDWDED